MGVFGSNREPKFYNGTADITLSDCTVIKDEPVPDIVQHTSPINGHRTTIVRGYHWVFEVRINIWKNWFHDQYRNNLLARIGETNHKIKRFGDYGYIPIDGSTDCLFTLVYVKPAYLTSSRDKDICFVRWVSNDHVQLEHNIV